MAAGSKARQRATTSTTISSTTTWPTPVRELFSLNREQVLLASDDQQAVGDRRRRHQRLAHAVGRHQLISAPGLEHEHLAVFAREVQMPSPGDGRGGEGA